ncbi:MAG: nitrogen fixation protein NifH [Candidatus Hodarchaeota archaeon]
MDRMEIEQPYLSQDLIEWLLEDDNPSVQYFTLTDIMDKEKKAIEVIESREKIMLEGIVPKILRKQKEGGYWVNKENFYVYTKYKGTVWSFLLLAELNADGKNQRIKQTCEFILNNSQDRESGGFSVHGNENNGGIKNQVIPCLTGNMIWALIRFGFLKDPRVQHGIEWILKYQRLDDGIETAPKGWPYDRFKNCWGKHTCHMGVVKNLKALTEIPRNKRSNEIDNFIEKAAEYMLNHRIYKQSHNLDVVAKEEWIQFGFPLLWKIDALEVLDILTKLGYKDKRMQDAINLVITKQNENGRWILEKTFNGRMQANIEQKGKESKWITLFAIRVLKRFYS